MTTGDSDSRSSASMEDGGGGDENVIKSYDIDPPPPPPNHSQSPSSTWVQQAASIIENGNGIFSQESMKRLKRVEVETQVIQVANIAPQATRDQMAALFGYVGKTEDVRLYPTMDMGMLYSSKIGFVKFRDSLCVGTAQHLTNTVFVDRALIVIPFTDGDIPDEGKGLELLNSGSMLPGIADPKLPQHVTSQLEGIPPHQVVVTTDPHMEEDHLPAYPNLPPTYDTRRIEEIRRTILIANLDPEITAEDLVEFIGNAGEIKYVRLCTRDNDPLRYALIEFTEQPSVLAALKCNGTCLGTKHIKVYHSTQAIVKPQAKTNEAAQKEIEEAMTRQAHTLISQGLDDKKGARRSRSLSRGRHVRSVARRSRTRSRSPRRRSGSRSRRRRSRSRSPTRRVRRSRSRSPTRVLRSPWRRRSKSRERKRSTSRTRRAKRSSSRDKDKDRKREKKSKKDKDRDREKDKDISTKEKDKTRDREREPKDKGKENGTKMDDDTHHKEEKERDKARDRSDRKREKRKSHSRSPVRDKRRSPSHEKKKRSKSKKKKRNESEREESIDDSRGASGENEALPMDLD